MSELAVKVENIGKAYRIGLEDIKHDTLGSVIQSWAKSPLKNFKRLRNLSKLTEESQGADVFWALKDINLEIKKGDVIGIIGRNGAGKSTLLKILSRVTDPTVGGIDLYGRVASLLEVGTGFNPELTGRENVFLNGTILGMTKKEVSAKYDEIVEFSGVKKFIDTPIKRYSSGMKVRLAFAVAAHLDPEILIIDEVLAVGDADFQRKCLGKMADITSEGRTILFVSHDMAAIQKLCSKCCLLNQGRIVEFDETSKVINTYLNGAGIYDDDEEDETFDKKVRKGTGELKFKKVSYRDQDDKPIQIGQTGSDLKIILDYELLNNENIVNPVFQLNFNNLSGQHLFLCLSRNSHPGTINIESTNKLICTIPKLPLLPGKYSVDIWAKFDHTLIDQIENAFLLEVEKGDYFGTGKINHNMKNGLLVNHNWEFV